MWLSRARQLSICARYGPHSNPEHDRRDDTLEMVETSPDRRMARLKIAGFCQGDKWLDRIYHLTVPDTTGLFGKSGR